MDEKEWCFTRACGDLQPLQDVRSPLCWFGDVLGTAPSTQLVLNEGQWQLPFLMQVGSHMPVGLRG